MQRSNLPTERKRRFPLCLKTAPASSLRPLSETRDELGLYTFEAALSTPVALADVQAIEIAGQEIPFAD